MRTSRFWQALETLGGAAPQCDWVRQLGADWAIAGALLQRTGDLAENLVCPRSSENGCLRNLVALPDGRFRADCGDVPQRCDTLRLEKDDVRILVLHRGKLASALIRAFGLQDATAATVPKHVLTLGRYDVRAGVGFAIFLGLAENGNPLAFTDLAPVFRTPGPKAVLIPYASVIDADLTTRLTVEGARIFLLDDVVVWDPRTTLAPRFDLSTIFHDLIVKLPGSDDDASRPPALALPPGTTWSSIRIAFENDELFNLSGPGVHRAVAPADIGMADKRTGKARLPWEWLRHFALHGGRIPVGNSSAQKHKQFVSEHLTAFTGIAEDPIGDDAGHYVAKFAIDGSGLKQGVAGISRRNFAGHR
ncbi:hypothetical protein SAMN05444279_13716 [Ruegeria intermedia]|uniref:Uncharacterized protein n=1 Tax=Ruegeria intermedia TaxID=996115 RepID=A0A1M5BD15_9RHOB|nr:hypothetical protein [Ruegeria intermedia]SHF40453.1 hypothetical protein SAMN05444279_13716 [Ruegeria intermedia]